MEWIYFTICWLVIPVLFYACHCILFYMLETDLASLMALYSYVRPIYGIAATIYLYVHFGINIATLLSFLITVYFILTSISENIYIHKVKKICNQPITKR
jgi:hypothetical protein